MVAHRFSVLLACALQLLAVAPAFATDCWLRCDGAASCKVAPNITVGADFSTPQVACSTLGLVELGSRVEGMLRNRGKVQVFAVARNQNVGAVVREYGSSDCAFADRTCRERRDQNMLAGRAGKAFDGPAGHKPAGAPCAIGLPCGLVLTPSKTWQWRVDEAGAANGSVEISALRMATGTVNAPVRDGRVEIAAGFIRVGGTYSYALKSASGDVLAAGQFSAAAAAIEADVVAAEREALAAGRSAATARLEALLLNELDWDAMQLTRP